MDNSPTTRTALRRLGRALLLPREKPASSSHTTLIIVASLIAVIVVVTASVLAFLHLRRRRLDREEARRDHEMHDYDEEVVMPQQYVRKPDGAVVSGPNGRTAGGGRRQHNGGRGFDQFGSSAETVSGPPLQKRDSDPFVDKLVGGGKD